MRTPYYLIHKNTLEEGVGRLQAALSSCWPNAVIGYSFKTNSLPWVLSFMKEQGCYAEVVSEDEYHLAEHTGYEHIIYNGPVKGKESFLKACKAGHIINLDASREIRWLKEAALEKKEIKAGLRVNFDLEAMCPGEASCGDEGGRFGFNYENNSFYEAMEELQKIPGVRLAGIHLHCSSKTRSLNIYRAIARMACRLRREYDLDLEYVDVGGGYFGGLADKPQYEDYLEVISEILKEEFDPERTCLIVEPGTSLICPPIDYVSTVTDVKETNKNRFVVTDGSRIHVDPLMKKKSYFYRIEPLEEHKKAEPVKSQVIAGFTCMEDDRLFRLSDAPALECGDRIIYEKVGAYTMCLSPLFSGYYPDVYLEDNGRITCVRRRWGVKEYIQGS